MKKMALNTGQWEGALHLLFLPINSSRVDELQKMVANDFWLKQTTQYYVCNAMNDTNHLPKFCEWQNPLWKVPCGDNFQS